MSLVRTIRSFLQIWKLKNYRFFIPDLLTDGEIELRLLKTLRPDPWNGTVPEYHFEIFIANSDINAGYIEFRAFLTEDLKRFGGNVGYGIKKEFRGNHYAAKSLKILSDFAKKNQISSLLITCEETNIASKRLANGQELA